MTGALKRTSIVQRWTVKAMVDSGKIDGICKAIEKLPLSNKEKLVFKALTSRELGTGVIGNTAKEILEEVRKMNDDRSRGTMISAKIWTVLSELTDKQLVKVIDGFPKIYVLNREFNPMHNVMYPYSLLESTYDVLAERKSLKGNALYRVSLEGTPSSSSGGYSTNQDFYRILVELISLGKKEILSTSLVAQSFEVYPFYAYALGAALDRGVSVYYMLSDKVPSQRILRFKELGIKVKVVEEATLRQHGIPNIDIVDKRHFIEVNKYEYKDKERVRFGFWCKYNKAICAKYVKSFWEIWKSSP